MKPISFETTKEEDRLIGLIVKRAISSFDDIRDSVSLEMDLSATHCNGTPLDFERLLAFDNFNFAHDIYGILNHIDRNTGEINGGFLPRSYKVKKFARKCSVTGVGMNEGWCYEDGEAYYSTEEIAEKAMIEKGYESLQNALDCGVIYWTVFDINDIEEE